MLLFDVHILCVIAKCNPECYYSTFAYYVSLLSVILSVTISVTFIKYASENIQFNSVDTIAIRCCGVCYQKQADKCRLV